MRKSAGFWVLLSLIGVLCFLGYLQYRWIDRLAQAEQEREQQQLRQAITRIAAAFDVEVTRAHIAFAPPPPHHDTGAPDWTERLQTWNDLAPYPRLIKDVYVSEGAQTYRITSSGAVPFSGEIPAGDDPVSLMPMRAIVFDGAYIRNELLPQLIPRHLSIERFGLRISSGAQIIYAGSGFRKPEVETTLFAFRPECFGPGGQGRRGPRPFPRREPGMGFGEHRGPGGPRGSRPGPPPWSELSPSVIARTDISCADAPPGREPGRWTLRAGLSSSAASGLREFRTRSLLLSFGVLAVLATGIGMLGLYAYRAHVLAQRQMEFAMAVSHELRTPLTVIRVAADNLSEGAVSDTTKYGELIRREVIRLSDMVEQVLVFARTQRADVHPHFEPVSPSAVIDRALAAVAPSLDSAGMRVERTVEDNLPPIHADANLVSAGLQNLLINASKYAASGGIVRVRAEQREQSQISIVVEDEGPGVKQSDLERIFSPFYRGSEISNSRIPGLGLGLHLVKRIAEAHGGFARAENRVGRGLSIEMRIPAVES